MMHRANILALICLVAAASTPAAEPAQRPVNSERRTADSEKKEVNSGQRTVDSEKEAGSKDVPAAPSSSASPRSTDRRSPATSARRTDRLELDTTVVTGNRELPKVLYIVPWKKADIGDLPAQPFNTLLDEALTPVDRDVFRREVTYYGAVSSAGSTPASPAPGPEK
jgi:hypothetical protein